jgi:NAD(P)-dependent dehydrogenase (short-subunit alcohol dehydrogenase family)
MSDDSFSLNGKSVIVTGASTGIGRAAAIVCARQGARVLLVARSEEKLVSAVKEIEQAGGTAAVHVADLSDRNDTLAMFDAAETRWGPIDGLIANAGIDGVKLPLVDFPEEVFDQLISLNLKSVFWSLKRLLPGMIARRSGSIVITGSVGSVRGLPLTSGYNVTKHAVLGLMRSAASEVSRHNVRVNCVIPGLIQTPMLEGLANMIGEGDPAKGFSVLGGMSPMERVGRPEELARAAAFLLSDAASYITGHALAVDGGVLATMGR